MGMNTSDFSRDLEVNETDCFALDTANTVAPNVITKLEFDPPLTADELEESTEDGSEWEEF